MSETEPAIRNISDTALWAALYRAAESERPEALFRDPFARRLAAERGEKIAAAMPVRDSFQRSGWYPVDVRPILKTAARARRVSFWMRLLALLPESTGRQGSRPWSAVCLLSKRL